MYVYIYIYTYTYTCIIPLCHYYNSYHIIIRLCCACLAGCMLLLKLKQKVRLKLKLIGTQHVIPPPPTSGFSQVEENTDRNRIARNSLAAGIRGWGHMYTYVYIYIYIYIYMIFVWLLGSGRGYGLFFEGPWVGCLARSGLGDVVRDRVN